MADAAIEAKAQETDEISSRVYEIGYHAVPTLKEDELDGVVSSVREAIETSGGSFIAEGAPSQMRLAYQMTNREGDKNVTYDRGFFGWIKFEANPETVEALEGALKSNVRIFRSIVFKTLREDTRATIKPQGLREVRRTDSIKPANKEAETSAPVSEVELEKALSDITE